MSKRLLIGMIVIALSAALVGAGTFAYFSDTETSARNSFTAGTLDLRVDGSDSLDDFAAEFGDLIHNLVPGDSGRVDVNISNVGSVAGVPSFQFTGVSGTAGGGALESGLTNAGADLAADLDIDIMYNGASVRTGTLESLDGVRITAPDALAGPGSARWTLHISIDPGVDNRVMGDSVTANVVFGLDQVH